MDEAKRGKINSHKNQWLRGLIKDGFSPAMRVLDVIENSDDTDWQERERWWIQAARESGDPLTNLDDGGRNGTMKCDDTKAKMRAKATGRKMSQEAIEKMKSTKRERMNDETRKRLGDGQRGKKQSEETKAKRAASMMGHATSEETKRKIGDANRGKIASEKTREKIRIARANQTFSAETRAKISAAGKGRTRSEETKAKMRAAQSNRNPVSEESRRKMSESRVAYFARKNALQSIANERSVIALAT